MILQYESLLSVSPADACSNGSFDAWLTMVNGDEQHQYVCSCLQGGSQASCTQQWIKHAILLFQDRSAGPLLNEKLLYLQHLGQHINSADLP